MSAVIDVTVFGLVYGSLIALIASGFALTINVFRTPNYAQPYYSMVAAYVVLAVFTILGAYGMDFWAKLVIGGLITAGVISALSVFVWRFTFNVMKRATLHALFLASVAVSILLENGALLIAGPDIRSIGFSAYSSISILGTVVPLIRLEILAATLVLFGLLYFFVNFTRMGKAMRAVAQNADAAKLVGINISTVAVVTFTVAGLLAAAAGIAMTLIFPIQPSMADSFVIWALAVAIAAGLGSTSGVIVTGFIAGLLEVGVATWIGDYAADVWVILLVLMIFVLRPRGIFGEAEL